MLLIKSMPGVFIQTVIWEPEKNETGMIYDMCEYYISAVEQVIFKAEYIDLLTFGVQPWSQEYHIDDGQVMFNYLIKTRRVNLYFVNRQLADEYFYQILNHFFPDIKVLEVRDQFKV